MSKQLGWIDRSAPLKEIYGQFISNRIVDIDGNSYYNCKFSNVTIRYGGGEYEMNNVTFFGVNRFETPNRFINGTVEILKIMGFLSPEFSRSYEPLPKSYFNLRS